MVSSQRDGMMGRDLGSSQIAGQGLHPARQRLCRALVSMCWEWAVVSAAQVLSVVIHPVRGTGHGELQFWVLQGVVTAPSLSCTAPGCAELLALHLPSPPAAHPASGAISCPGHQQAAGTKPLCLRHLYSAADHPGEPVSKGGEGGAAVTRRRGMLWQGMSVSS